MGQRRLASVLFLIQDPFLFPCPSLFPTPNKTVCKYLCTKLYYSRSDLEHRKALLNTGSKGVYRERERKKETAKLCLRTCLLFTAPGRDHITMEKGVWQVWDLANKNYLHFPQQKLFAFSTVAFPLSHQFKSSSRLL